MFIILGVHAIYVGTAIMEGTYERYIMPSWPLLTAGPILALGLLIQVRRKPGATPGPYALNG